MSKEPLTIAVPIGEEAKDYRMGDYLNALDHLTCYFAEKTAHSSEEFAYALRMYANSLES